MDAVTGKPIARLSKLQRFGQRLRGIHSDLAYHDIIGPIIRGKEENTARYWRPFEEYLESLNSNERRDYRENQATSLIQKYRGSVQMSICLAVSTRCGPLTALSLLTVLTGKDDPS